MMFTNFKMIATTGAATLLLLAATVPASAAPIWDVNFEGDTVGSNPAVAAATAGITNTMPTSILEQFSNTVLVENGYTDTVNTGASLSSNVLVLTDDNTGGISRVRFDGADADAASTGIYEIRFDMVLESTGSGGNNFLDIRNTAGAVIAGVQFTPSSSRVRLVEYSSPNTVSGVSDATVASTFFADELSVTYRFDFGAATQEIIVDGASLATGDLPGLGAVNLDLFEFATASSTTHVWAIDNVTGVAIPEPSSIALVGLGLFGMIGWGARRRK